MQGMERKAYKYGFYPTEDQSRELARTFGCLRYVDNWALALRTEARLDRHERIDHGETDRLPVRMKKEPEKSWLADVSCVPLPQALRHRQCRIRQLLRGPRQVPALPPQARPAKRHIPHRRLPVERRGAHAGQDGCTARHSLDSTRRRGTDQRHGEQGPCRPLLHLLVDRGGGCPIARGQRHGGDRRWTAGYRHIEHGREGGQRTVLPPRRRATYQSAEASGPKVQGLAQPHQGAAQGGSHPCPHRRPAARLTHSAS